MPCVVSCYPFLLTSAVRLQKNFGKPVEWGMVQEHPWSTPHFIKLDVLVRRVLALSAVITNHAYVLLEAAEQCTASQQSGAAESCCRAVWSALSGLYPALPCPVPPCCMLPYPVLRNELSCYSPTYHSTTGNDNVLQVDVDGKPWPLDEQGQPVLQT